MVAAVELARPLTIDDLADYPDDGMRREIVTGELVVTPAPTPAHQIVAMRLSKLLAVFVDARNAGFVMQAPVDVELTKNDVVEPDIIFIDLENAARIKAGGIVGPPDVVVEILSPSTCRMDPVRKRALYASSGIPEYWIVDPDAKKLEMLRLSDGLYEPLSSVSGVHRSIRLPGLTVDATEMFKGVPGL
ncbi:MAG: Uma2 family endonuclease [Thermomicrobiales bacterium]|nr:Uma2 family endonuclease [Thermomicrobiales bacterium]